MSRYDWLMLSSNKVHVNAIWYLQGIERIVCLLVCLLFICLSINLKVCLSASIYLFVCLHIYILSISLSICLFMIITHNLQHTSVSLHIVDKLSVNGWPCHTPSFYLAHFHILWLWVLLNHFRLWKLINENKNCSI